MTGTKEIGRFYFPANREEAQDWTPNIFVKALHRCVLCVATTRAEGLWSAYCGNVPGKNHDDEWGAIWRDGDKLPEAIARAIFPQFDGVPYAG